MKKQKYILTGYYSQLFKFNCYETDKEITINKITFIKEDLNKYFKDKSNKDIETYISLINTLAMYTKIDEDKIKAKEIKKSIGYVNYSLECLFLQCNIHKFNPIN